MDRRSSADPEGVLESSLRYFSVIASVLVIAGWLAFAVDQTRDGSQASQAGITNQVVANPPVTEVHHGAVRQKLDDVNRTLLTPFRGITSSTDGDWVRHSVPAVLALLMYGFGVGYLARFARGRA